MVKNEAQPEHSSSSCWESFFGYSPSSEEMYNIGLYKNGNLLVVQQDVPPGDQVNFQLQPRLSFGVVPKDKVISSGDTFRSKDILARTEFDLNQFPCGLVVTLTKETDGGKYIFSSS